MVESMKTLLRVTGLSHEGVLMLAKTHSDLYGFSREEALDHLCDITIHLPPSATIESYTASIEHALELIVSAFNDPEVDRANVIERAKSLSSSFHVSFVDAIYGIKTILEIPEGGEGK